VKGTNGEEKAMGSHDPIRETLMRYLDGELAPDERRQVEEELKRSTELQRELAIYRSLQEDFSQMSFRPPPGSRSPSVWMAVNRRLTRPVGWILMATGILAWVAHVVYVYVTSPAPSWEKAATSAIVIGILLLFATVIHDRVREMRTDPYRDVER
jgi:anti-sigma factor RsiW